ncbi:MAG TPA: hypothetical protein VF649_06610 [Sphingomonas sp.]|jgi:hypothetical protein|uniref:hypothetical protein n=1 Tax=Sphingomonas sp. TaxID=28214 RepID=UPI002ED8F29F
MRLLATEDISPVDRSRDVIDPDPHARLITVRDAMRGLADLLHDGGTVTWCGEAPVSRGDLSALMAVLGDQLEAAIDAPPNRRAL